VPPKDRARFQLPDTADLDAPEAKPADDQRRTL
jgi:hypothetical protein